MVDVDPPLAPSTRMTTRPASGATPTGATLPADAMMPETLVPWPLSSLALPAPLWREVPLGQQLAQKHCSSTIA